MAEKKMRSIEERKAAMLADLEALEAKQIERYRKELSAKQERADELAKRKAKLSAEIDAVDARIIELNNLLDELEGDDEDADEDDSETESFASVPLETVAG